MKFKLLICLLLSIVTSLQAQKDPQNNADEVQKSAIISVLKNIDPSTDPFTIAQNSLLASADDPKELLNRMHYQQTPALPQHRVFGRQHFDNWEVTKDSILHLRTTNFKSAGPLSFAPTTIIGTDDREQVLEQSHITKAVGIVYSSFADETGDRKCTGTSIGDDYIITAAHCVYDKLKGFAKDIAFVPGLIKSRAVYDDRYFAQEVHILKAFKEEEGNIPSLYDIAIIKVKNEDLPDLSREFGFLDISSFAGEEVLGDVYSYPADKKDGHSLWKEESCLNLRHESGVIASRCDTYPGASGAALIDSNDMVIAINSAERDQANLFAPITPTIRRAIDRIKRRGRDRNFIRIKPKVAPYYSVHLRNNCHKKIKVVIMYSKKFSSKKEPEGYFEVEPGEVYHNVIKTQDPILGLFATDEPGELEWWGRDFRYETAAGKVYNFYEEDLPPIWKDKTFSFNCN